MGHQFGEQRGDEVEQLGHVCGDRVSAGRSVSYVYYVGDEESEGG